LKRYNLLLPAAIFSKPNLTLQPQPAADAHIVSPAQCTLFVAAAYKTAFYLSYSMTEQNDEVEFLLICISAYKKLFEGTLLAQSILSQTLLTPMP
jgi:hypothetical protein